MEKSWNFVGQPQWEPWKNPVSVWDRGGSGDQRKDVAQLRGNCDVTEAAERFTFLTTGREERTRLEAKGSGVTGPADNDQDQTTTTLQGHCVVLKFQNQALTCQDCQAGWNLVLKFLLDQTTMSEKCCGWGLVLRHRVLIGAALFSAWSPGNRVDVTCVWNWRSAQIRVKIKHSFVETQGRTEARWQAFYKQSPQWLRLLLALLCSEWFEALSEKSARGKEKLVIRR